MKQLLICRHAKSSWKDLSLEDFDRPLNKRGKRDAPLMGKKLASQHIHPDLIVSSPAKRAKKTAKKIARELQYPKNRIVYKDTLYNAFAEELITCIRELDDRFNQIIMVGHNTGFTDLVNILGNLQIDNVPTSGVVALNFPIASWKDVKEGGGELAFFFYPKMFLEAASI